MKQNWKIQLKGGNWVWRIAPLKQWEKSPLSLKYENCPYRATTARLRGLAVHYSKSIGSYKRWAPYEKIYQNACILFKSQINELSRTWMRHICYDNQIANQHVISVVITKPQINVSSSGFNSFYISCSSHDDNESFFCWIKQDLFVNSNTVATNKIRLSNNSILWGHARSRKNGHFSIKKPSSSQLLSHQRRHIFQKYCHFQFKRCRAKQDASFNFFTNTSLITCHLLSR